jgi:hypothetical protein
MKIEVAVPPSATTKERGDLLESLAEKLLIAQSYRVVKEIRSTAVELDLLCQHQVSGRQIYVECKAYRDNNKIDANILKNLAGTLALKDYDEAWLISTSEYGKEAKGFVNEWQSKPERATKLSFYEPDKVIRSLINSGVIKTPPKDKASEYMGSENLIGDWILLITGYGNFWVAATLAGGLPNRVICYYANNNEMVIDIELLENLAATDTSLNKLDFKPLKVLDTKSIKSDTDEIVNVVEVQTGDGWSDYRPARPQDFVGRSKDIQYIFDFFKKIQDKETSTRVFALTGDSGMGKSSLVAKLANKAGNLQNKNKYFVYPVDVRAATSSVYIYSALLICLKKAQSLGIGNNNIELTLSDVSNPLNSESIKSYLESVEKENKLIVLIFDQFEELYSKPELYEVFDRAKALLLDATALKTNFCLGFAWKSDSTTPSEHPAYFFWHQLSDYRLTRKLSPFSDGESKAAINTFEKEINQKLHNDLRHNLLVSSQGYPWLLKKLCIHLYEKIEEGTEQNELLENKLDVSSLFDSDLQQLNQAERTCLTIVAQRAPVDWLEVIELLGADNLNSLIHRRLVVKSGDRLNIYWDIFREYILTKKVPIIPLRYLPLTDFTSVFKIASCLKHNESLSVKELVELSSLSEGTVQNIGSDINMFGIAIREDGEYILHKDLIEKDELKILRIIREKFKKHAFTLALQERSSRSLISLNDAITVLQSLYPNSAYADKTWHAYTVKMCRWLEQCGFLVTFSNGWIYRDQGDVIFERENRVNRQRKLRKGHLFFAPASPALTLESLNWLIESKKAEKNSSKPKGYRNALSILTRFELATVDSNFFYPNTIKIEQFSSLIESIWTKAQSEPVLLEILNLLRTDSEISSKYVGEFLSKKYSLNWTEASKIRNGSAVKQWAMWLYEGEKSSSIPKCPGRV